LSLGLELLLLEGGGLAELEVHGVGGELGVGVGKGVKAGLHNLTIKGVKEDLLDLAAFSGHADLTAGDAGGGNDVVKDGGVHGLEGTGAGSLLGSVGDGSGGDDGSVGNNKNWLLVLGLEVFLNKSSDLLECTMRSVWDSHEEVLGSGSISLSVVDVGYGVDENDAKMGSECLVA